MAGCLGMRRFFLLPYLLLAITNQSLASDWWTVNVTPQIVEGNYPGSPVREKLNTTGAVADFQYLERFGFAVGDTHLNLHYKYNIPALTQDAAYFSVRDILTPDLLPGTLTLRLDTYRITGNDPTNETDGTTVYSPIVSFLNYEETWYLDLGYAYSRYGSSTIGNGDLNLSQVTPTFGFAFNEKQDWLQVRLYGIHSSNPVRSQNISHTFGSDISLTHYITPDYFFIPNEVQPGAFIGERIYAVDNTALIVYNLGDIQKNSIYLQAKWYISDHADLILNGGSFRFNTLYFNTNYSYKLNYIYAGINFKF